MKEENKQTESVQNSVIVGQKNEKTIVDIEYSLRQICFKIKQKGREILEEYHVTPPQFDALQFLVYDGEMTVSELSAKLFLAPSTITDLVDRMERNGHVSRVRDTKDRRIVKIMAEENGKRLISEVIERRGDHISTLLSGVEEVDRRKLLAYLEILNSVQSSDY